MDLTDASFKHSIKCLFIPSLSHPFFSPHRLRSYGLSPKDLSRKSLAAPWRCCAKPGTPQSRQHKIPQYYSYERDNPFNNHESQVKQIKLAQQYRKKGQWRLALAIILELEDDAGHLTSYLTEFIHLQSLRTLDKFPNATALDIFNKLVDFISDANAKPDVVTYNAILCALQKRVTGKMHVAQDTLDVAFRVLDHIERRGLKPDEFSFSLVYRLCAIAKDPHYLSLFERRAVQVLGHTGDEVAGSSLVCAHVKIGDMDAADAIAVEMSARGAILNDRGYSCLISSAYRSGRFTRIIELFHSMPKKTKFSLDPYSISTIITSCLKVGDSRSARLVVETMEKRRIHIPEPLLERVFLVSLRCDDIPLAIDVIFRWGKLCTTQSMRPEEQNNQAKKSKSGFAFKKNQSDELQKIALPNPGHYCVRLLTAIGRSKHNENVKAMIAHIWDIISKMESEDGLKVETSTLNAAASSLAKLGQLDEAMRMIEEDIPRLGLTPDVISYNVLIRILGSAGQNEKARKVMDTMRENNVSPDQGTFNSLLQIASRSGDTKLSAAILDEIQQNPALEIDSMAAATLMTAMRKARDGNAALRLHAGIVKSGRLLDAKAYGLLLATLCESGNRPAAIGVFGWLLIKKLQPQRVFFNVMIHQLGKGQSGYKDAERLFAGMKRRGIMTDEITYTTMVRLCAKHGQMGRAFRLVSEMQDLGLAMSSSFAWSALIDGCGRAGMWERGVEVLKMMRRASVTPTSLVPRPTIACYNAALYASGIHGEDWPNALEIFQALLTDEAVSPSIISYSSMASIILRHRFEVREIGVVEMVWMALGKIIEAASVNNGWWEGQVVDGATLKKLRAKVKRLEWIVKLKGQYIKGRAPDNCYKENEEIDENDSNAIGGDRD